MPRRDSFTFLRLVFALAVIFSHSFVVGGFGDDPLERVSAGRVRIGSIAVMCFFVVSGFLITGSALRQPSLRQFSLNRVARILPGYWTVLLLTVFVLAPAITLMRPGNHLSYWDSIVVGPNSALSYLWKNAPLRMVQLPITDIFASNPHPQKVNASLWSLTPEVICYFCLGIFTFLGGLRWRWSGTLLFGIAYALHVLSLYWRGVDVALDRIEASRWIFGFHTFHFHSVFLAFLAGMACYQFRDALRWRDSFAGAAVLALAVSGGLGGFEIVWPFALPHLVLYLAHRLPFEQVENWGDFSYGVYIYGFPLQQCLALAGAHHFGFPVYFAASTVLSLMAGVSSWFALERPVLRWARTFSRRVQAAVPAETAHQLGLSAQKD